MKYIDTHCHFNPATGSTQSLLNSMDDSGIDIAYLVGGGLLPPDQIAEQIVHPTTDGSTRDVNFDNQALLRVSQLNAKRLRPFYFVNPWQTPPAISELQQFWGLKFAAAIHGRPYQYLARWFEAARQANLPVYTHCLQVPGFTVADLVELGKKFPDLPLILGHGGVSQMDLSALKAIRSAENIYIETSGTFSSFVRFAVEIIGDNRILFGSEYPLQSPKAEIVKIETSGITLSSLQKIAHDNAARLFARKTTTNTSTSAASSEVHYAH